MLPSLKLIFNNLLAEVPLRRFRYLYQDFNLDDRLTGLIGARGVGKTTLMLQYIKLELSEVLDQVFYFSADHIYFTQGTLYEFIEDLYLTSHTRIIFIDEIHKYPNWNQELKNLYDGFPQLKIIFSGSSSLDLIKGSHDLSRRARVYHLAGLSLREYINFNSDLNIAAIEFNDLIKHYHKLDQQISQIPKIKGLFKEYLQQGFYPFYHDNPLSYYQKLLNIVDKTIYEDIAKFYHLKTENLLMFKKILNYLATIPPGTLSTGNIAKNIDADPKTIVTYLEYLQATGMLNLLFPAESGNKFLRRPDKIFLNNTTLHYALNSHLGPDINVGAIRELFFIQAVINSGLSVTHCKQGDYKVNNTIFEIGGKNKTRQQIKTVKNSYIVKDNILISESGVIPLIYFGFLY